ncbi:hypothetical protein [Labrenzia sp. 011]|uniref:hypothetical protein n=1 Tax=Labrenzia sp. 011 TaxID=2171494 RepID=UPI0010574F35|nr:hypothetical protein [Labrenzia sp. 011]
MEAYARKPDAKGRSVDWILSEARRDPEASVHVDVPKPPELVHGIELDELAELHDELSSSAQTTLKSGKSRKIRKDQKTLVTVVASYPVSNDELADHPTEKSSHLDWERRTVAWLKSLYSDDLVTVVRHVDERYPHLHAYIIPRSDPEMRAMRFHPGQEAKRHVMEADASPENKKELNRRGDRAYRSAMSEWQDSYHQSVGIPCGLTRLGPKRRRLSRDAWHAEQTAARAAQAASRELEKLKASIQVEEATREEEFAVSEPKASFATNNAFRPEQREKRCAEVAVECLPAASEGDPPRKKQSALTSSKKLAEQAMTWIEGRRRTLEERVQDLDAEEYPPEPRVIQRLEAEKSRALQRLTECFRMTAPEISRLERLKRQGRPSGFWSWLIGSRRRWDRELTALQPLQASLRALRTDVKTLSASLAKAKDSHSVEEAARTRRRDNLIVKIHRELRLLASAEKCLHHNPDLAREGGKQLLLAAKRNLENEKHAKVESPSEPLRTNLPFT